MRTPSTSCRPRRPSSRSSKTATSTPPKGSSGSRRATGGRTCAGPASSRTADRGSTGDGGHRAGEHWAISDMLHEIDWVAVLGSNDSRVFLHAVSAVVDHPLESERGETTEGENGEFATDDEGNSLKKRCMAHTRRLEQLRALVPTSQVAEAIHEDVAFFDAVRPSIAKIEAGGRDSSQTDAALEIAVQQIVSEHMSGSGLIDIY